MDSTKNWRLKIVLVALFICLSARLAVCRHVGVTVCVCVCTYECVYVCV